MNQPIKLDISEAVALLCFMGDAIFAKEERKEPVDMGDKMLYNGIALQVNAELPDGDEHYSLYEVE